MNTPSALILANFGGPRTQKECYSFLESLFTDFDLMHKFLPSKIQLPLLRYISKKRVPKIQKIYNLIGGKSPIYKDTAIIADYLEKTLCLPVITFHRYLPLTHHETLKKILELKNSSFLVFPLFPFFSYAVTGSMARFLHTSLPKETVDNLSWIKSFGSHSIFTNFFVEQLKTFLQKNYLIEKDCIFIFTTHGLPISHIKKGDPYQKECEEAFNAIKSCFPKSLCLLCYQSKNGPLPWLKPYTETLLKNIIPLSQGKRTAVLIPFGFVSENIETLFEIDFLYTPILKKCFPRVYRMPTWGTEIPWLDKIASLISSVKTSQTHELFKS